MYDLTVSQIHTFAVGQLQLVVHNCGSSLMQKAMNAVGGRSNKVGAAAIIRGRSGQVLFDDAAGSSTRQVSGPFKSIIQKHLGDMGNGCFAGGCAERWLADKIIEAADANPAIRGRPIQIAIWMGKGIAHDRPCPTCTDIFGDLSSRLGSKISVQTSHGRILQYG
ncbi:MAG: hypothetical protein H0X24_17415 [Ktedonobacterales bacterium]|nr:hypothetical protein [Ktedonobacterales bacterium]